MALDPRVVDDRDGPDGRHARPGATVPAVPPADLTGPLAGELALYTDLPSLEIPLGVGLPSVSPRDGTPLLFARSDGAAAALAREEYVLQAFHSPNGGRSFEPAVVVAGGGSDPLVLGHAATLAPNGTLHCVFLVLDPAGNVGLRAARSADMGRTWSTPVAVVGPGSAAHGLITGRGLLAVDAGPDGKVAVGFARRRYDDYYAAASSDGGVTWTTPVRIDPGAPVPAAPVAAPGIDVAVGAGGTIHAVFTQNRPGGSSSLVYARSTTAGASFEAERVLAAAGRTADVALAADGSILVGAVRGSSIVSVHRSADDGATFSESQTTPVTGSNLRYVVIAPAPDFSTVLVGAASLDTAGGDDVAGPLYVWRSPDFGVTLGTPAVLAQDAIRAPAFAIQRTPTGTWAVAWTDARSDAYARLLTDVYVRTSLDDGVTWGLPERADTDVPGSSASSLGPRGLAATGSDDVVAAWADGRYDQRRSTDLLSNDAPAPSLAFLLDQRVDADLGTSPANALDPDVATDGVSHVYAAYAADATGPYSDIYVSASANRGQTFGTPVRVGGYAPGTRISKLPQLEAVSTGQVYLVFQVDDPYGGGVQIRFNRSLDRGATWQASDTILGTGRNVCNRPIYTCYDLSLEDVQLEVGPSGRVYVAWADTANVYLARSTDFGASFTVSDVDQGVGDEFYAPALAVQFNQVVLGFIARDPNQGNYRPWAVTSANQGQTWSAAQALQTSDPFADSADLILYCDAGPNGQVLCAWTAYGASGSIFANRWSGSSWSGDRAVTSRTGYYPRPAYSSATRAIVTYEDGSEIHAVTSTDGGLTFGTDVRLDLASPNPDMASGDVRPVADDAGNLWVVWHDDVYGMVSALVVRHSADHGDTFGPVYRVNRDAPQGGRPSLFNMETPLDTFPGVAFIGYIGARSAAAYEPFVNAYDIADFDRDRVPAGADCNDRDPGAAALPGEVRELAVGAIASGARVRWTPQALSAGPGTVYDVVDGALGALLADRGYAGARCLAGAVPVAVHDDQRMPPASGSGIYYLARARNSCGTATYGSSSLVPDPRDALDATSPCP